MINLDEKQIRLIKAWIGRAKSPGNDEYGRFMAAWLAFNAFCYAGFSHKATRRRPDLAEDRGLEGLEGKVPAEGVLEMRDDGRVRLSINKPGRIRIDIRDRYTEDIVFTEFARRYKSAFQSWIEESSLREARDGFLTAIERAKGCYVINMLKCSDYDPDGSIEEMARNNIIVIVSDPNDLENFVDVLYQVRCNVFHGEKIPGEVNDDQIVKAALPFLLQLLQHVVGDALPSDYIPE